MDKKKNQVFILLGSNLGERVKYIESALSQIGELGLIAKQSSLYKTEPWMMQTDNWFVNQVIMLETDFEAEHIMTELLTIEKKLGRIRTDSQVASYSSRTIDLDMLYFNDAISESEFLHLPHPRLHERRFTLLPLAEIAPDFLHPKLQKTQSELLMLCTDHSEVISLKTK